MMMSEVEVSSRAGADGGWRAKESTRTL
jgi:hypothetical protein